MPPWHQALKNIRTLTRIPRFATILAPSDGVVTDVRLDIGNFAASGQAQMTFIATEDLWIQADFTENNLGNIKPGDEVELVFDALPGNVVKVMVAEGDQVTAGQSIVVVEAMKMENEVRSGVDGIVRKVTGSSRPSAMSTAFRMPICSWSTGRTS